MDSAPRIDAENPVAERKILSWWDKVANKCIEKGAPEGWTVAVSSLLGTHPNYTHYEIKGAVYLPLTKGLRKGKPNFKKPVPGTEGSYIFSLAEFRSIDI